MSGIVTLSAMERVFLYPSAATMSSFFVGRSSLGSTSYSSMNWSQTYLTMAASQSFPPRMWFPSVPTTSMLPLLILTMVTSNVPPPRS